MTSCTYGVRRSAPAGLSRYDGAESGSLVQLMPLNVGDRIAHYDVTALIGEGGMGQVYQATDTKLVVWMRTMRLAIRLRA